MKMMIYTILLCGFAMKKRMFLSLGFSSNHGQCQIRNSEHVHLILRNRLKTKRNYDMPYVVHFGVVPPPFDGAKYGSINDAC